MQHEIPSLALGKPKVSDDHKLEYTNPDQPFVLKIEYMTMRSGIMIWDLRVNETLRNQGIGSSVVKVLKQICTEENLSFLAAYRILKTATDFWKMQDFEVIGHQKDAVWRPVKS